jgi:hypothetical protein
MSTGLVLPTPILVSAPTGHSQLPIVELNRKAVKSPRKQIRLKRGSRKRNAADCSFGNFTANLAIDAWRFFHAAKKTELTRTFTTAQVDRRALAFGHEHADFLIWNTPNLRRVDRSVFELEDFSGAGLAGRFGEAIAYLTMVQWGYVYWDRIAVLWERAATHSGMNHSERVRHAQVIAGKIAGGKPRLAPDFAFEKPNSDVALMEAKGSFVHPVNDNPTTKDDLRHALEQLAAWSGMITPTPAKSFAIGTYFRDESDATGDPSLITFVDPPGKRDAKVSPVELPSDWIRRGNYGAWIIGMGFPESGDALRRGSLIEREEQQVAIVTIAGREFAITFDGVVLKGNRRTRGPFPMPWIDPWFLVEEIIHQFPPGARFLRDIGVTGVRVSGIDRDTLKLIEEAVLNPKGSSLMRRDDQRDAIAQFEGGDGFAGSILPDGTLYGQIDPEMLTDARLDSFRL